MEGIALPPKISAVLIVRDDESTLGRCLTYLEEFDDIVVVDTGSTDNSVEIAKWYTNKVFRTKWEGDFAKAREYARSLCDADWILSIDGDEVLGHGGYDECEVLAQTDSPLVYEVLIKDPDGMFEFWAPRLYRNVPDVRWQGKVHNTLVSPEPLEHCNIIITHYKDQHKDPDRSYRMLTDFLQDHPDAPRENYFMGRELAFRGEHAKALSHLDKCIRFCTDGPLVTDAKLLSAKMYHVLGEIGLAFQFAVTALIDNLNFREAAEYASMCAFESGDTVLARLLRCLAGRADNHGVRYISHRSWLDAK